MTTTQWHRERGLHGWWGDTMKLILPDIRQKLPYDCGATAARIVYDYLGIKGKPVVSTPLDGTDPAAMEAAFRASGLCVLSGTMTIDDLWHHTRKGRPVVCLVTHAGTGHYVVAAGVERRRVHYQCPDKGTSSLRRDEWERQWQDLSHRWGHNYIHHGIAVWV